MQGQARVDGDRPSSPAETRWRLAVVGLLIVAAAIDVRAGQPATGLHGTVREPAGVIPGVVVQAIHADTGARHETVTNAVGAYSFGALPSGRYTVRATMSGFSTFEQANVVVGTEEPVRLDIELALGGLAETVVVTAGGFEQKIVDAPASISVLTRADLETKQYDNLAEALTQVEPLGRADRPGPRHPAGPRVR